MASYRPLPILIYTEMAYLNPFTPEYFTEKCVLMLVEWFSGHCHANIAIYRSYTLQLLSQMQNIILQIKFGHVKKAKFQDNFWV